MRELTPTLSGSKVWGVRVPTVTGTLLNGIQHGSPFRSSRSATAAGDRFDQLELNALAQVVQVTNDRSEALISVCARIEGVDPEHAADMPYLLVGTVDEIVEHIVRCDERWGITYFVVRELEEMAPIIAAMQVNRP